VPPDFQGEKTNCILKVPVNLTSHEIRFPQKRLIVQGNAYGLRLKHSGTFHLEQANKFCVFTNASGLAILIPVVS
jgi:hypothetical protein